jgi:hypothetical protein
MRAIFIAAHDECSFRRNDSESQDCETPCIMARRIATLAAECVEVDLVQDDRTGGNQLLALDAV